MKKDHSLTNLAEYIALKKLIDDDISEKYTKHKDFISLKSEFKTMNDTLSRIEQNIEVIKSNHDELKTELAKKIDKVPKDQRLQWLLVVFAGFTAFSAGRDWLLSIFTKLIQLIK